ncbi:MAG: D-2-hydroxyacid dehydrogenase, partial [Saprospiraceae bacterium]|nr:D-2-hydroxyacid dehydrogenase [Saprospiraceae bacterium]
MKSIVILDGHTLNPGDLSWEKIKQLGRTTIYPRTSKEEVLTRV